MKPCEFIFVCLVFHWGSIVESLVKSRGFGKKEKRG